MASRTKCLRPSSFCRWVNSAGSRPSLPSRTVVRPSSLKRLPAASMSSSFAGSGHSIAIVVLLSLKLRRRLRNVRSRRLRFQLSSRSRGLSSFCGRRSISSSNCGVSSRTCASTAEVFASMTGRVPPPRSSGLILAVRARLMSTATSRTASAPSAICLAPCSTACLKRAGCPPVRRVVSTRIISWS